MENSTRSPKTPDADGETPRAVAEGAWIKWLLLVFVVGAITFIASEIVVQAPRAKAELANVEKLFRELAFPPNTSVRSYSSASRTRTASVSVTLGDAIVVDDALAFYDREFQRNGWTLISRRERNFSDNSATHRTHEYRKGNYSGSVSGGGKFSVTVWWTYGATGDAADEAIPRQPLPAALFIFGCGVVLFFVSFVHARIAWRKSPEEYAEWRRLTHSPLMLHFTRSVPSKLEIRVVAVITTVGAVFAVGTTVIGILMVIRNFSG